MTKSFSRITHYIPPAVKFLDLEKEFVEPCADDYFIHWLFRHRCMECQKPGAEINEIIPRSRSKRAILDWKNRVVLCRTCHESFHHNGVTIQKIKAMQETRREYLKSIGREQYL